MCGFVGYLGDRLSEERLRRVRDTMTHRGPDACGIWEGPAGDRWVGLGFRRLRIIDLSDTADQPMSLDDVHLVFNGEIYNFLELRAELEARHHQFRTRCDTEVVLHAYREWGADFVQHLEGMFAIAVWDGAQQQLVLVRDRLGIKPLYWSRTRAGVTFGSSPYALLELSGQPAALNEHAVPRFLALLWTPDPETLFRNVHRLPAGHMAVFSENGSNIRQWWDVEFTPRTASVGEHIEALEDAVLRAVKRQLTADVPVGVFLSGGIDSTLIAAMASSDRRVIGVSTGFSAETQRHEHDEDDLSYARLAAKHLPNVDHREIVMSAPTMDLVREVSAYFDDPVADPASLATYLICRSAKPSATVMLSGVGAEELFGGYPRHRAAMWMPSVVRVPRTVRAAVLPTIARQISGSMPGPGLSRRRHAQKLIDAAAAPHPYVAMCLHHTPATLSALMGRRVTWEEMTWPHMDLLARTSGVSALQQALYLDLKAYLPCLNLAYVDRASMACSVEVRVPLLDELVVRAALSMPDDLRVQGSIGKRALRLVGARWVPREITERPKTGFSSPVRAWLRDSTGDVESMLSRERVSHAGLSPDGTRAALSAFREGRADNALALWAVLELSLWQERFVAG